LFIQAGGQAGLKKEGGEIFVVLFYLKLQTCIEQILLPGKEACPVNNKMPSLTLLFPNGI